MNIRCGNSLASFDFLVDPTPYTSLLLSFRMYIIWTGIYIKQNKSRECQTVMALLAYLLEPRMLSQPIETPHKADKSDVV